MNASTLFICEAIFFAVLIPFAIWMKWEQNKRLADKFSDLEKRLARIEGKMGLEGK
jgi:hypothetical protein